MDDESEISGGSSPFLESPDAFQPQERQDTELNQELDVITTKPYTPPSVPTATSEKDRQLLDLEYKLSTLQNEYELEKLQAQRQFKDLEKKHKATVEELEGALDNTRLLHDENERIVAELDKIKFELHNVDSDKDSQIHDLEVNVLEKDKQIDDLKLQYESESLKFNYEIENLQTEKENADELVEKYNTEIIRQANDIKKLSKELNNKNDEILNLKNSNILNSHPNYNTEEFQDLSTMNKLFKEQAQYCKELEEINLKQANELKKYRNAEESSSFWKTESERLELKVQKLEYIEKKFEDTQIELLDLKTKLTQYNMFTEELKGRDTFDIQPEDIINELDLLKKENLVVIDENSKLNINMSNMKILNEELALERTQLLNLNKDYENNIINLKKLNYELEQQKILSFEECKLLRQQLQDLDDFTNNSIKENTIGNNDENENLSLRKIDSDTNNLIENYKNRTGELTGELKKLNEQMLASQEAEAQNVKKRKLKDTNGMTYYSQRINELQLENGKLSRDLQKYQNLNGLLETKLTKLLSLKEKKIRIVELRDNPLARDQFVKRKNMKLLQQENTDLLAQLQSNPDLKTIPISVYESLNFDIKQQEQEIFKANKKFTRLKEVYNKKSLEFIDVVNSILGFKLEFRPDNKVKIYSCYMPKTYLVVDLKHNTLESNMAIDNWDELLETWIEKRGQIPCFLATITLQLFNSSQAIGTDI
ncbi:similar to Saccharomyces cerevisiae YGL086W MAD1 Coiled-coil protein involved in the spindle-assembly checkpoint [Maudiozyma saulgeensis]|uniref:Spindle assembly checkpoint component MAD1 n=1 Tax=Maudiozyma saulgeensis TaxID=1789683 RepID=A0A1X7R032_9SACH|nr:similar to Saccharomyces cerevisiae YGL086W MAD1 Coiled-coil protein involved in the spindle-assembly checkpoint [Kazachstania saulgeensis]